MSSAEGPCTHTADNDSSRREIGDGMVASAERCQADVAQLEAHVRKNPARESEQRGGFAHLRNEVAVRLSSSAATPTQMKEEPLSLPEYPVATRTKPAHIKVDGGRCHRAPPPRIEMRIGHGERGGRAARIEAVVEASPNRGVKKEAGLVDGGRSEEEVVRGAVGSRGARFILMGRRESTGKRKREQNSQSAEKTGKTQYTHQAGIHEDQTHAANCDSHAVTILTVPTVRRKLALGSLSPQQRANYELVNLGGTVFPPDPPSFSLALPFRWRWPFRCAGPFAALAFSAGAGPL
ncbi:hypothetical protein R3P38DRAFT_2765077 [Favolaschia claudopus]|uniref:Uncharacterized protein n=1 Tax=Favolaschia claudopus TaxID=2862362 RepID=A0AAW0D4H8_9AGAR